MSLRLQLTPFTDTEWSRRIELVDAIAVWTAAVSFFVAIVYGTVLFVGYSTQFLVLVCIAFVLGGVCLLVRRLARHGSLELAAYLLSIGLGLMLGLSLISVVSHLIGGS